ncbi:hypothetical protein, conserved [Entamoeba dispar SAW760]|uniref:Flavodoxin-like domain-containing protein n=1 Tax=Entamoeba dispar (strain ATCC PRA-260 / SAW760) TaxID=370354 RepID=B0EBM5_ENTDS|nr:uncharacterized protein EDI_325140 [Entamoeba dispar SAW760]EDR28037.1 hypothetical protein, conserved [Entamoeba dispar SAW760]|eukprot:EDR28037.1 hypothetical protein, conserved [Entamoeba dispar SAW760]
MTSKVLEVLPGLYWVGVMDYELKKYDVLYPAPYGSTYNSYLLKTQKGNVLFETVKQEFANECLDKIEQVIGKEDRIDYIIVDHSEPDHSGSLSPILKRYPNATVVASTAALNNLQFIGHIRDDIKTINTVKTKQLNLGDIHLKFIYQPFLHWPDTMITLIEEMNVLVTCDMFSTHFADERMFDDLIIDRKDQYLQISYDYFNSVFGPFKRFVLKGIQMLEHQPGFDLKNCKAICCSHGPILRGYIRERVDLWRQWAQPPSLKNKVVIAYGSVYGYTETMANTIASGIKSVGIEVSMHNIENTSSEEVLKDFDNCKGLLLGTPTIVGDALPSILTIACNLNPYLHCQRFIQCFGSHGWSGEGVGNLSARLRQLKAKQPVEPLSCRLQPGQEKLEECFEWGKKFGLAIKEEDEEN